MNLKGSGVFVVGNNWQLSLLTAEERRFLDSHPRVFMLNNFPSNWRKAGFRGTYHVFGDTKRGKDRKALRLELDAFVRDPELLPRLKAVFVTNSVPEHRIHHGPDGVTEWDVPFGEHLRRMFPCLSDRLRTYKRGRARRLPQRIARDLHETVFHYASTLTDAVNLAAILYPTQPIRVLGNPFGVEYGYFYSAALADQTRFLTDIWLGLRFLRDVGGIDVRDANLFHGAELPEECRIPRELVWSASK